MLNIARSILMSLAVLCFFLSAFGISTWKVDRESFTATGLALWSLAVLLGFY